MWIIKNPNGFLEVCWVNNGLLKIEIDIFKNVLDLYKFVWTNNGSSENLNWFFSGFKRL